jgi:hypothetical protein
LEELARMLVGDGKNPNLFFVSVEGNVVMISRDFDSAYRKWREHAYTYDHECALEDRKNGTISSVEPEEDDPLGRMTTTDDSKRLGLRE